MFLAMGEFFFCLLPSLIFLLVTLLLQKKEFQNLAQSAVRHLARFMWTITCRFLKLPYPTVPGLTTEHSEVQVICKPTALAIYLKKHCQALSKPPLAAWPQTDPHLQMIFNLMWPTEEDAELRFRRDHLLLHDDGIVALDWAVALNHKDHIKREHRPGGKALNSNNSAIVILIPNALGRVTPHLLKLCHLALQQGFYPVVFHRRGQGGCPLTTPRYQEFGNPSDLIQAVAYLRNHHPSATLFAISEGSGSGLLLSYLGERGSSSYLMAAACISPVFHGQMWFESELPWIYKVMALIYRKLQINRYATALSSVMDVAKILNCKSLRDMEKFMFCSLSQQNNKISVAKDVRKDKLSKSLKPDWAGYWDRNEPLRDADEVAVPVLCLYSTDDPLLPPLTTLPETLFNNNPYFLLAMTQQGGHCSFTHEDKHGKITSWSNSAVLEYFHVVADFFGLEDKKRFKDDAAMCCGHGLRRSTSSLMSMRRSTLLRKERPAFNSRRRQISTPSDTFTLEKEQEDFTWNRSYTR